MLVRDCMGAVVPIEAAVGLAEAAASMARHGVRHLPVVRRGRVVGLVSDRELLAARPSPATSLTTGEIRALLQQIPVAEIMVHEPAYVVPGTPLAEAVRLMRDQGLEALPVLRDGQLVGLLTEATALGVLATLLEGEPGSAS
jgi:acetoin utilization protein AcuB